MRFAQVLWKTDSGSTRAFRKVNINKAKNPVSTIYILHSAVKTRSRRNCSLVDKRNHTVPLRLAACDHGIQPASSSEGTPGQGRWRGAWKGRQIVHAIGPDHVSSLSTVCSRSSRGGSRGLWGRSGRRSQRIPCAVVAATERTRVIGRGTQAGHLYWRWWRVGRFPRNHAGSRGKRMVQGGNTLALRGDLILRSHQGLLPAWGCGGERTRLQDSLEKIWSMHLGGSTKTWHYDGGSGGNFGIRNKKRSQEEGGDRYKI